MRLNTNTIDSESVRTVERDGQQWLVAPTVLATSMELNGGYLPTEEIKRSASDWNGTPIPIGHPQVNGTPVSIKNDDAETPIIGEIRNAEHVDDGEKLVGESWINVSDAQAAGREGEQTLSLLRNGDALEVSTAYFPGRVTSGEFDGAYRDRAVLNTTPDHLAALPNETGKCSVAHGCGAGDPVGAVAANQLFIPSDDGETPEDMLSPVSNKSVAGVSFDGTAEGELDESELPTEDGEYADHYLIDGESKSDSSFPVVDSEGKLRRGNVASAWDLRGHADDKSELESKLRKLNSEFDSPPIDTEQNSDAMNDQQKIDWLADNTAYDRHSLVKWEGERCLTRLYNAMRDTESEPPSEDTQSTDTMSDNDGDNDSPAVNRDEVKSIVENALNDRMDSLEEELEETASEVATNAVEEARAEARRADLIDTIVDNSENYEREELTETPEGVLENIRDSVTTEESTQGQTSANFAGQRGASPAPSSNSEGEDPAESFPSLSVGDAMESDD